MAFFKVTYNRNSPVLKQFLFSAGGPLWKWFGNTKTKAFVIGIVSRGKGCARADSPGNLFHIRVQGLRDCCHSVTKFPKFGI